MMKDLIDKLSESILSTCKEAVDQTYKTVDQTKYRTDILTLKSELKKLYQKLGEEYYNNYMKDSQEPCSVPTCNRITAIHKEINRLEEVLNSVMSTQKDSFEAYKRDVRSTWNEDLQRNGFVQKDENGVEILKFCPKCSIGNPQSAGYCVNCGNKF